MNGRYLNIAKEDDLIVVRDNQTDNVFVDEDIIILLNKQYNEIMLSRSECTRLIILLKNIVKDLKQMDTKKYAEHIEKHIDFLSNKYLE